MTSAAYRAACPNPAKMCSNLFPSFPSPPNPYKYSRLNKLLATAKTYKLNGLVQVLATSLEEALR